MLLSIAPDISIVSFDYVRIFVFVVRVTFTYSTFYVYVYMVRLPVTVTFAFYDSVYFGALRFDSTPSVLGRLRVTFYVLQLRVTFTVLGFTITCMFAFHVSVYVLRYCAICAIEALSLNSPI